MRIGGTPGETFRGSDPENPEHAAPVDIRTAFTGRYTNLLLLAGTP